MAPRTFKNLLVAVAGTFSGYKQADLKNIVETLGATFSPTVTDECTHLVATEREVEKGGTKVKQAAKAPNCAVVSIDWLIESRDAKKPLPESGYQLGSGGSKSASQGNTNSNSNSNSNGNGNGKDTKAKDDNDEKDKKTKTNDQAGKKRTHAETQDDSAGDDQAQPDKDQSNKKMKDAQKATSKPLRVDVDEACQLKYNHEVFIDEDGLIWDATLNQAYAAANNNKFYRIQVLRNGNDYKTWTRWGRVGEAGQSALLGNGDRGQAQAMFEKKFKDKSGLKWEDRLQPPKKGKYTFIEKNYEEESDDDDSEGEDGKENGGGGGGKKEVESALPKPVQNLMAFIFNQQYFMSAMASMSYDVQKMPLGKLSKRTIQTGYEILKDLAELIASPDLGSTKYGSSYMGAAHDLSNQYFTTIPHDFGRNRPPILNASPAIQKEIDLLDSLSDMGVANNIMKESKGAEVNQLDRQFQSLGMNEMTPLDHASTEFKELAIYLENSRGGTHGIRYKIINIFRIDRRGEKERFNKSRYSKLSPEKSDRRLLWHGSRSTNYGGILSQGLRIAPPEAPVSGYMYGKGVYFADMSSKSANYCFASVSANMGLLLLCDVELGNPMLELKSANFNAGDDAKKQGCFSTLGVGGTAPPVWKDAGSVHPSLGGVKMPDLASGTASSSSSSADWRALVYNEYIAYDVAQIQQRYLFHVQMNH